MKPTQDKEAKLTKEEQRKINDAMPSEAKYGDVFDKIASSQVVKLERLGYRKVSGRPPPLTDEEIRQIRETIYPFAEATPIEDGEDRELETIVEVVQERTAQAQRDAAVKHYEGGESES